ncbi:MAG TPA: hypothetical protein VFB59_03415 [Candidatus Saccharimonadales bacterium]|nr:hypothetical protein [Candidatus Saccharimonadales bacterium]
MDAQQKQQIADRLLKSNNILVTVSSNPSVDQLAACIGLTLALNKMGKHAAAVFSGAVPNTLEFLQPEKTIEKTTDSLRDFIISLDKAKADKLRYKVEDKVVKIFITPYKTSISDKDLEFSQGDFNVDIVLALGVHNQSDIDQAITAHGRILHDAVLSTINVVPGGELGTVNWLNAAASSLCEMVMQLLKTMNQKVLDGQMATAFLTGIVAETQRFSNARTQPATMTISAELMAAGANQQLVATKLEPPKPKEEAPKPIPTEPPKPVQLPKPAEPAIKPIGPLAQASGASTAKPSNGTIEIEHTDQNQPLSGLETLTPQIDIDREGTLRRLEELQAAAKPAASSAGSRLTEDSKGRKILQPLDSAPPSMIGALSPPTVPGASMAGDGFSVPQPNEEDIERPSGAPPLSPSASFATPSMASDPAAAFAQPAFTPSTPATFGAPPSAAGPDLGNARDAVSQASSAQPGPLPPVAALNALPVNLDFRGQTGSSPSPTGMPAPEPVDPTAPPPVPPPMLPPIQP